MEGPRQPGPLFTRFWDSLIENFVFPTCRSWSGRGGGMEAYCPLCGDEVAPMFLPCAVAV
jgi:hypothetical protein